LNSDFSTKEDPGADLEEHIHLRFLYFKGGGNWNGTKSCPPCRPLQHQQEEEQRLNTALLLQAETRREDEECIKHEKARRVCAVRLTERRNCCVGNLDI
jgi:hypothetical protein